jgi:hypothetical protein
MFELMPEILNWQRQGVPCSLGFPAFTLVYNDPKSVARSLLALVEEII